MTDENVDVVVESPRQIQRYLKLTDLIPPLLEKLDEDIISFMPAVELSPGLHLGDDETRNLIHFTDMDG